MKVEGDCWRRKCVLNDVEYVIAGDAQKDPTLSEDQSLYSLVAL